MTSSGLEPSQCSIEVPELRDQIEGLRARLVDVALKWESAFGVAPRVTSELSELDAALIIGCPLKTYSEISQGKTAVQKGVDFVFDGVRYQVKANRPSGKPGSDVTLVAKARNYDWDVLVWVHYTRCYEVQEAWSWPVDEYKAAFHDKKRLGPSDYRRGRRLV